MRKHKEKKLVIGISNLDEMGQRFISAWKRAEKGLPVDPTPHLYFENIMSMWKNLTPRRMELVHYLRNHKSMSIRQLAKSLNRDYKDVHSDVQSLLPIDLVQKDGDGLISVPWDSIVINLAETAVA